MRQLTPVIRLHATTTAGQPRLYHVIPHKPTMTYPLVKFLVKLAYWVFVYFVFVPVAKKKKDRNRFGWFVLGLISFPLPVIFAIAAGNLWRSFGPEGSPAITYSNYSAIIGVTIGVISFSFVAKRLRSLPALKPGLTSHCTGADNG